MPFSVMHSGTVQHQGYGNHFLNQTDHPNQILDFAAPRYAAGVDIEHMGAAANLLDGQGFNEALIAIFDGLSHGRNRAI